MKTLRNFALGAAVATILLAPAASADVNRVLSGQALGPVLAASESSPLVQVATAFHAPFPHLLACVIARLAMVGSEGS